jgi:hypothetical protein
MLNAHLKYLCCVLAVSLFFTTGPVYSQQVPDTSFNPVISHPMYAEGKGSDVYIDEGHYDFHTREGRYKPFAKVLEKDGYVVKSYTGLFTTGELSPVKILVIANALNKVNATGNWTLPAPSAFTSAEIQALEDWVKNGGSLFLIADHMPWPGANGELAKAFGFTFHNGFSIDVINPSYFLRSNQTVVPCIITTGRDSSETIYSIPNTEGQAISIPPDAQPVLLFDKNAMMLMPDTAWNFHSTTPLISIAGLAQLAYKQYGKGRVVVCGEASMFSAQIGEPGGRKMGMNRFDAPDNYKLLLNIIHWLDGRLN